MSKLLHVGKLGKLSVWGVNEVKESYHSPRSFGKLRDNSFFAISWGVKEVKGNYHSLRSFGKLRDNSLKGNF